MLKSGELALCYISTIRFASMIPEMTMLELPYVVRDCELERGLDGVQMRSSRVRFSAPQ